MKPYRIYAIFLKKRGIGLSGLQRVSSAIRIPGRLLFKRDVFVSRSQKRSR